VLIDNTVRAPEAVATALQAAARVNPDTEVRLRADATVPYGRVVELMGQAQAAGLSRIAFVAQRPAAPSQ
jgi:biopolymer transport protein TolR